MLSFQLYMKMPEKYHPLIKMQEDQSTFEAQQIRENILLPIYNEIQDSHSQWDFRKKTEWWTSEISGRDEVVNAKVKLPATKPGDAGYFPLHDNTKTNARVEAAKKEFKQEMYPGNASLIQENKDV